MVCTLFCSLITGSRGLVVAEAMNQITDLEGRGGFQSLDSTSTCVATSTGSLQDRPMHSAKQSVFSQRTLTLA
jgi:hypothetical protein